LDKVYKLDPIPPRFLRYRNHYKIYVFGFVLICGLIAAFWGMKFFNEPANSVVKENFSELVVSVLYFLVCGSFYFFWLKQRMKRAVQVFETHILIHDGKKTQTLNYEDIESVNVVCWSIFYVKLKTGFKHYFNSSLERVDYIWEGVYRARPDLVDQKEFEAHRLKLVQYDHHQKRKEWFFKHKMIDIFTWGVLPVLFVLLGYMIQSQQVVIHHQGVYFFRLFMYGLLVLLATACVFSLSVKKFVFDRKISNQMDYQDKVRDLEFEGMVLQRSKLFQLITASLILAVVIKNDVNLFSVSKVKEDIASFSLKKGNAILIDNRFNCLACKFRLKDGDLVVFGRGTIGQVLAQEGDMVGVVSQDKTGRMIASENVQEVPRGHLAVRATNGKDIMFVKIGDLIGRIQK
jgi:preprotein translocase subunit YajC